MGICRDVSCSAGLGIDAHKSFSCYEGRGARRPRAPSHGRPAFRFSVETKHATCTPRARAARARGAGAREIRKPREELACQAPSDLADHDDTTQSLHSTTPRPGTLHQTVTPRPRRARREAERDCRSARARSGHMHPWPHGEWAIAHKHMLTRSTREHDGHVKSRTLTLSDPRPCTLSACHAPRTADSVALAPGIDEARPRAASARHRARDALRGPPGGHRASSVRRAARRPIEYLWPCRLSERSAHAAVSTSESAARGLVQLLDRAASSSAGRAAGAPAGAGCATWSRR